MSWTDAHEAAWEGRALPEGFTDAVADHVPADCGLSPGMTVAQVALEAFALAVRALLEDAARELGAPVPIEALARDPHAWRQSLQTLDTEGLMADPELVGLILPAARVAELERLESLVEELGGATVHRLERAGLLGHWTLYDNGHGYYVLPDDPGLWALQVLEDGRFVLIEDGDSLSLITGQWSLEGGRLRFQAQTRGIGMDDDGEEFPTPWERDLWPEWSLSTGTLRLQLDRAPLGFLPAGRAGALLERAAAFYAD